MIAVIPTGLDIFKAAANIASSLANRQGLAGVAGTDVEGLFTLGLDKDGII